MRTAILVEALVSKYGSISGASRRADIPLSTLFKLQREHVDVRVSTLVCVANALGCPVSEVMRSMEECDDAASPQQGAVGAGRSGSMGWRRSCR